MTFGVGPAGYDVRIAQDLVLQPGGFALGLDYGAVRHAATTCSAIVHDKSTWARRGLACRTRSLSPAGAAS